MPVFQRSPQPPNVQPITINLPVGTGQPQTVNLPAPVPQAPPKPKTDIPVGGEDKKASTPVRRSLIVPIVGS